MMLVLMSPVFVGVGCTVPLWSRPEGFFSRVGACDVSSRRKVRMFLIKVLQAYPAAPPSSHALWLDFRCGY